MIRVLYGSPNCRGNLVNSDFELIHRSQDSHPKIYKGIEYIDNVKNRYRYFELFQLEWEHH
jgi:hypothetical protein